MAAARTRVFTQCVVRRRRADEARQDIVKVGHRRNPPPESRASTLAMEYVDEHACLTMLFGGWRAKKRYEHIGADVGNHAPDHRMRDLVEPGEPEQRERLQELDAERPVLDEAAR